MEYAYYPPTAVGGVVSINGDTTPAQLIVGGTGISVSTVGGTTTITNTESGGTVTSAGLADSTGIFNITGSPVTTAGTLTLASLKSQTANTFLAAPNGSAGSPTFRAIVAGDIPSLSGTYLPLAGGTMAGAITGEAGTVSAPSFNVGNSSTGLYQAAANQIGIAVSGVNVGTIGSSGTDWVIGNTAGTSILRLNGTDLQLNEVGAYVYSGIYQGDLRTAYMALAGGNTYGLASAGVTQGGGQIYLFGDQHATFPDQTQFYQGTVLSATVGSAGTWTFGGSTFSGSPVTSISQNIAGTFQISSAATAGSTMVIEAINTASSSHTQSGNVTAVLVSVNQPSSQNVGGYAGTGTKGADIESSAAATGSGKGNIGVYANASGGNVNIGLEVNADVGGGSSQSNYGVLSTVTTTSSTNYASGYFALSTNHNTAFFDGRPNTNAVVLMDNGNTSTPILVAQAAETTVFAVGATGGINSSVAQTTLTGSAGTAVCSQPFQGSSYKKAVVYLSGYTDTSTQTYTFPTPFLQTPYVSGATAGVAGATATTTTVTFTVTTATGFVILEGY